MAIRSFAQHHPQIGEHVFIDEMALVLGDVILGAESSVWPMAVLRGDVNTIRIGAHTNIQDGCILHVRHEGKFAKGSPLIVGDEVTVGHGVILHACTIGHRCLIGMGSIILDEAILEDEVMIGAKSLVSPGKRLESGYLYLGSPAKAVRPLTLSEKSFLRYSAAHYVKLKNLHLKR